MPAQKETIMGRIPKLAIALGFCGLAGCGGGSSSSSRIMSGITVTVSPSATSVVVNQQVPFTATVMGTANTAVTWEVAGVTGGNYTVGTIDANGNYRAPVRVPNPSTQVVTSVLQSDTTKTGTGRVQVFQTNDNQSAQNLPIILGTSGGNSDDKVTQGHLTTCCSGTLGSLVVRNGINYILSNNHVLARSDQASPGEPITQPGLIDANCGTAGTHTVANLTSFANLQTGGTNVDVAIAQVVP